MDDSKHKLEDSDSLNQELDSLECHLYEWLHPSTKTQHSCMYFLYFWNVCFIYVFQRMRKKQNKIHWLYYENKVFIMGRLKNNATDEELNYKSMTDKRKWEKEARDGELNGVVIITTVWQTS